MMGCGGAANDGDPTTDTSSMIPPDTGVMNSGATDTAAMINSNTGAYPTDTGGTMKKPDTRSSSSAYPDGKGGKARDTSRQ